METANTTRDRTPRMMPGVTCSKGKPKPVTGQHGGDQKNGGHAVQPFSAEHAKQNNQSGNDPNETDNDVDRCIRGERHAKYQGSLLWELSLRWYDDEAEIATQAAHSAAVFGCAGTILTK
jgi:hypothetical protein